MDLLPIVKTVVENPVLSGGAATALTNLYMSVVAALNKNGTLNVLKPFTHVVLAVLSFLSYFFAGVEKGTLAADPDQVSHIIQYYLTSLGGFLAVEEAKKKLAAKGEVAPAAADPRLVKAEVKSDEVQK